MTIRFLLPGILFAAVFSAYAADRLVLKFELIHDDKVIDWGRTIVTEGPHTWSKGLKRSYLRLRCHQKDPGEMEKLYSTVDHFTGLRVTHRLVEKNIELTVIRSVVQPRLVEIRALPKRECKDLSPIATTQSETYNFPAEDGYKESHPFGEDMTLRFTLQSVGGTQ